MQVAKPGPMSSAYDKIVRDISRSFDEVRYARPKTCTEAGGRLETGRVLVLCSLFRQPRVQSRLQAAVGRTRHDLSAISGDGSALGAGRSDGRKPWRKAVPRIEHAHASAQAAGGVRPRQANP